MTERINMRQKTVEFNLEFFADHIRGHKLEDLDIDFILRLHRDKYFDYFSIPYPGDWRTDVKEWGKKLSEEHWDGGTDNLERMWNASEAPHA